MRPFLFFLLFFNILFSSLNLFAGSSSASQHKKIIVLGDSLSEGYGVAKESAYPALLEKKLHEAGKPDWDVINAGISGSTSASAIGRMKWLFKNKPQVVLLVMGANDGLRGLKVEETEKNLVAAIVFAQKQQVQVILGGLYMPPNYGKDYTEKFKRMYLELSKKYKLTFIPFVLDQVAGNPKYNLADGIHPNEEGHRIVAENIFKVLKDIL